MAFAHVSSVNLTYNQECEGLPDDALARQGLSGGNDGDLAAKAFGAWRTPQFRCTFTTTTAADTGSSTLNLATSTRSEVDPQASPSNPLTKTLGPVASLLTSGVVRPFRCRVKQSVSSSQCDVFWFGGTLIGGSTPVVRIANGSVLGSKRASDDVVTFTAAASSLVVTITHGTGNANITWTVDVFLDDPC